MREPSFRVQQAICLWLVPVLRGQPWGESHFSWKAHGVDTLLPGISVIDFSFQRDVKARVIPSVDTER